MSTQELSGATIGFGISFFVTSIFNTLLVILKETQKETVLVWMKNATSHHWITHGILVVAVFLILGFIFGKIHEGKGPNVTAKTVSATIVWGVILSVLGISAFYI